MDDEIIPDYAPLTPIEAERRMRFLQNEMSRVRKLLQVAREDELKAKHAWEKSKRRTVLIGGGPKVSRGGHTVLDRDMWLDEECGDLREVYEFAKANREAAKEHLETLYQQGMLANRLSKSVEQTYGMSGVAG
jgi:hypothetical protein